MIVGVAANGGGGGGLAAVPSMCLIKFFDSKKLLIVACHNGQFLPSMASFSIANGLTVNKTR